MYSYALNNRDMWEVMNEGSGEGRLFCEPKKEEIDVERLQKDVTYWKKLKAPRWAAALALQDMKREIWWSPEKWAPVDFPKSKRKHGCDWGQYDANECLILAVRPLR